MGPKPENITARVNIIERHERAVVALVGLPSRPVIIPIAGVDFEPVEGPHYKATMSMEIAKDVGILI